MSIATRQAATHSRSPEMACINHRRRRRLTL